MTTMTDITSTHLEAALLDQIVACTFRGKRYAFVAVVDPQGGRLGVAVEKEAGYNPTGKTFDSFKEAEAWADGLNKHIGLKREEAVMIVASSMFQRKRA
jgi:hypothetical protein